MPTFSFSTHPILLLLFSILTILLLLCHSPSISAARPLQDPDTTDFIRQSCNTTTYPDLCYSTLSTYANQIQNSPKELACAALNATLSEARVASGLIKARCSRVKDQGGSYGNTTRGKRGKYAMKDCMEVLKDALDELKMSVEEMQRASPEEADFRFRVNNVQTWVSAALTDDDTCMDGLKQGDRNTEDYRKVREEVVKVGHLTSVALALINNYAASANP